VISRLEIKGFKSLVDVSIDLGAVNIFIGANGSGKSNLLEAVGLLSAIAGGTLEEESIRYRGVRRGNPTSYRSSFANQPQLLISLSASDGHTLYVVDTNFTDGDLPGWIIEREYFDLDGLEIFSRTNNGLRLLIDSKPVEIRLQNQSPTRSVADFASFLHNINRDEAEPSRTRPGEPDFNVQLLRDLGKYAIFAPGTAQLRGFLDDIHRDPLGLGGSGLGQAIKEMRQGDPEKLGPFDIEDVYDLIDWADSLLPDSDDPSGQDLDGADRPTRLRIGDRFMGGAHKSVSALEASEGALYVLFLLALVGHERSPRLFAVDNFDQALHPRLACALTRLICNQIIADGTRQMLATTHSPLVLNGLDLLDDRIRLFAVDRDPDGATRVDRIMVTEELMAQADQGLSLSRLWVMGRLGGVPHNL